MLKMTMCNGTDGLSNLLDRSLSNC
uniref:Uncharacterized protein n=1 Tax=Anguilla anguilla TaxID=7936 RepID=A0A0E9VHP1_ANGAN